MASTPAPWRVSMRRNVGGWRLPNAQVQRRGRERAGVAAYDALEGRAAANSADRARCNATLDI